MKTLGIAGGGQLGRMLAEAAHMLGIRVVILDPTPNSPASQVADEQIVGEYKDRDRILELAAKCDAMTFDIESVNAEALEELSERGFPVHPIPATLSIIKDKLVQKRFFQEYGIPAAPFYDLPRGVLGNAAQELDFPMIVKVRSGGFDGRGNVLIASPEELPAAMEKLKHAPAYAEQFVRFEKELAIVAARTVEGDIQIYPLVETIHKNHICHEVLAPAQVGDDIVRKTRDVAQRALASFEGAGIFAIEMFLVDGEVLVNEIAPRVHNSGHFSIEACEASQFENHVRAVTGMPLRSARLKVPAAVMVNILGERSGKAEPKGIAEAEAIEGVKVHIYGKMDTRPERKMGHVTAVADTLEDAKERAEKARALISI